MESRYKQVISMITQAGYDDIANRLSQELKVISADTYRIAVVGEFKTGKSTLINRIFIKEDILFTDIMEATAIPTEIRYAPDKYLEIIPYETATYDKQSPFDETDWRKIEERIEEGQPFKIENPTTQDIQKYTVAIDPEERNRLVKTISRVRLYYPSVNLAGLTVFDTPGINSLNEAIIMTTYRLIPESDIVLFLTNARQLSTIELQFLSSRIFSEGITRILVVIVYDPDALILTDRQKENLIKTIKSQLASIGHSNIPVELVNIRDTGNLKKSDPLSPFKERVDKASEEKNGKKIVSNVIGNLLSTQSTDSIGNQVADIRENEKYSLPVLEDKLIRYIRENVRPARIEKALQVLKSQIYLAMFRAKSELASLEKNQLERQQILHDIETREQQIRMEHENLIKQFHQDMMGIQNDFLSKIAQGLDQIRDKYIDGFDLCQDLGELQDRLSRSQVLLKQEVEDLFIDASRNMTQKIQDMALHYDIKSRSLLNPLQSQIRQSLSIQGGIFAEIPPAAVLVFDFSLFLLIGPLRPLARVLIRLIANEIPFINKVLPAAMAASLVKYNIKRSLSQQFIELKKDIHLKLIQDFKSIQEKIIQEWKLRTEDQLKVVRSGIERTMNQQEPQQRKIILEDFINSLESLVV